VFGSASRAFWEKVEDRAGDRKAIVSALRKADHEVSVQAVGAWVRGEYEPPFPVFCWASAHYGVSMDDHIAELIGEPAAPGLAQKVTRLEETQARIMSWLMNRDPEFAESLMRPEPEQAERGA